MAKYRTPSEIEKHANVTGDWRECTRRQNKALEHHALMDWLAFEATLRAYLREFPNQDLDEIVSAFTGRGPEDLNADQPEWAKVTE